MAITQAPPAKTLGMTVCARRFRTVAYLVILLLFGAWSCFYKLGDPTHELYGHDEPAYAVLLDNMMVSGDWVSPQFEPGQPHLNKPPLYYWLSSLSYNWLEDGLWRYRAWSAGFAVAAMLLTGWLGARWLSPEAGLIAGLALGSNTWFIFEHGGRVAAFDTALTFCALATVTAYVNSWQSPRPWLHWSIMGLAAAAAALFKHPVLGLLILGVPCLHHIVAGQPRRLRDRLAGPVLALILMVLLAVPWHIAQWLRWDDSFIQSYFLSNVVDRATTGLHASHAQGASFYLRKIFTSSWMFIPALPAGVLLILAWWRRPERRAVIFFIGFTAAYILLFSLANDKLPHYVFPVYPFLALLPPAFFLVLLPELMERRFGPQASRLVVALLAIGMAYLVNRDIQMVNARIVGHPGNLPYVIQRYLQDDLASGRAELVLHRFLDDELKSSANDYLNVHHVLDRLLPNTRRTESIIEVNALITSGKLVVLLMPPALEYTKFLESLSVAPDIKPLLIGPRQRPYRAFVFNGSLARLNLASAPGWTPLQDKR